MGCGESKQAVATENTLTKSKSKAKKQENTNDLPVEKPTNDDANVNIITNAGQNVEENEKVPLIGKENDNSTKKEDEKETEKEKEKEKEKEVVDHGHKESGAGKKSDEAVVAIEEDKIKGDGKNDEDVLKGGEKENVAVVSNVALEKDDDEETIESIISDGISGKSDYYSPRSKGHVSEGNDDEEKDAEAKSDKEKEEVIKVEEVKVLSVKADEPQSSGEEKIMASKNETANAASTAEVKAN